MIARWRIIIWGLVWAWAGAAQGEQVTVAVAANFSAPMREIAADFSQATKHEAVLVFGATGHFYAQIKQAAPFDVFLAADSQTPERLIQEGWAAARLTYAVGKLVVWRRQAGSPKQVRQQLASGSFDWLALADPKFAPYGAAAMRALEAMGLERASAARRVLGQSVGQAYQLVATGHATLGMVAASQVMRSGRVREGAVWPVPAHWYAPIRQEAVLLRHAQNNPAAQALMRYLQSESARAVIRSYGYGFE